MEKLWLELKADQSELKQVECGLPVEITTLNGGKRCKGRVIYVSDTIDAVSRKGIVRVEVANVDNALRCGEFAVGRVALHSERKCVLVPREAVQLVSGETVVFVPAGKTFITRVVKTGSSGNGVIEIVSGLAENEKFVSHGAFGLKSVMLTAGMDPHAGHGH